MVLVLVLPFSFQISAFRLVASSKHAKHLYTAYIWCSIIVQLDRHCYIGTYLSGYIHTHIFSYLFIELEMGVEIVYK